MSRRQGVGIGEGGEEDGQRARDHIRRTPINFRFGKQDNHITKKIRPRIGRMLTEKLLWSKALTKFWR